MDSIVSERRAKADQMYSSADREALLARIVELEAALYPFSTTFGSLDDKLDWGRASLCVTSKLYPYTKGDRLLVFNKETHKSDEVDRPAPENLHEIEYYLEDSMSFSDNEGGRLHDSFEVISVHETGIASSIFCGSIWMEDVRRAVKALNPPAKTDTA